jgi:hypothetical protein
LKHLSTADGDLKLYQVSQPARTVFELIRLNRICEIVGRRAIGVSLAVPVPFHRA